MPKPRVMRAHFGKPEPEFDVEVLLRMMDKVGVQFQEWQEGFIRSLAAMVERVNAWIDDPENSPLVETWKSDQAEASKGTHLGGTYLDLLDLPLHRTEAGYPNCSTCDGGGCPDCTDSAYE